MTMRNVLGCKIVERLFHICVAGENKACIADAENHVLYNLSKHIVTKYELLVDSLRKGSVCLLYNRTGDMVPDILTTNMTTLRFSKLMFLTGIA